jgi:hypothetical protein
MMFHCRPGTCGIALRDLPRTSMHELSVGKLQAWLDSGGKSPREQAIEVTLRQPFGRAKSGAR